MPSRPNPIGKNLRRLRQAAGLSQRALAAKSGLSRATIAAVERGRYRGTDSHTLHSLAAGLGVDVRELLADAAAGNGGETNAEATAAEDPLAPGTAPHVDAFVASRWAPAVQPSDEELDWLRALPFELWRHIDPGPQPAAELLAWRRRHKRGGS